MLPNSFVVLSENEAYRNCFRKLPISCYSPEANLLFLESPTHLWPVGVGYSYIDITSAIENMDARFVSIDLHLIIFTELNITFELLLLVNRNSKMMQSRTPTPSNNRFPLYKNNDFFYIAGESYAGKREGNSLSPNTYIAKIEPHNESSFVFFF